MSAIEKSALTILERLEAKGFEAYFVGGYVRDKLLGRPVHDIDIATAAKPEDVMNIFPHTIPTGLKHGTVTVIEQGHSFEVTTFRKETEYVDYRRPKDVEFVSDLVEDLKRRDFTMNAMALDRHGNWIDPFGGQNDLKQKVLRCVGNAEERFREDALRIVRCIRFAAEYELEIEAATWAAILRLKPLIVHIAMERIRAELERMIEGSHPERGLPLFVQSEIAFHLKQNLHIAKEQWAKADAFASQIAFIQDADLRWYHLLWLLQLEPHHARETLKKLTFSNERMTVLTKYVQLTSDWTTVDAAGAEQQWKQSVLTYGEERCRKWLEWICTFQNDADFKNMLSIASQTIDQLCLHGAGWIEQMPVKTMKELQIDGNRLQASLETAKGPRLGKLLKQLLIEAALGHVENDERALIVRAEQLLQHM